MSYLSQHRFWVFDMDGTLTQSVHDFAAIRQQLGIPPAEDILTFIDAQSPQQREVLNRQLIEIEESLALKAQANPGVEETLQKLTEKGCLLGIVTRNKRHCVDIILEQIGCAHFFHPDAIVASETVAPKPDPAGILLLLEHWQGQPESTVMVGDYRFDLEAGRAAGTTTVHYAEPGSPEWPEQTDHKISHFDQLITML